MEVEQDKSSPTAKELLKRAKIDGFSTTLPFSLLAESELVTIFETVHIQKVENKTKRILNTSDCVKEVQCEGINNRRFTVISESNPTHPNLVEQGAQYYKCSCLSKTSLCAHTFAVACITNDKERYIQYLRTSKPNPKPIEEFNGTKQQKNASAGKKGSIRKRNVPVSVLNESNIVEILTIKYCTNIRTKTVPELRLECIGRDLDSSGKKADLVERILICDAKQTQMKSQNENLIDDDIDDSGNENIQEENDIPGTSCI